METRKVIPDLLDVVELIVDLPERDLPKGQTGTITWCFSDGAYEVEFVDATGWTMALIELNPAQFIVVWDASEQAWIKDVGRGNH